MGELWAVLAPDEVLDVVALHLGQVLCGHILKLTLLDQPITHGLEVLSLTVDALNGHGVPETVLCDVLVAFQPNLGVDEAEHGVSVLV